MKPRGQGRRARVVTGHSFHILAPVPQPSTAHAPDTVEWHPGPQPSAAVAGPMQERVTANKIVNVLMRCSSRPPPDQYSASYSVCGPVVAAKCGKSGVGQGSLRRCSDGRGNRSAGRERRKRGQEKSRSFSPIGRRGSVRQHDGRSCRPARHRRIRAGLVAGVWDAAAGEGWHARPNDSRAECQSKLSIPWGAERRQATARRGSEDCQSNAVPMIFVQIMAIGFCGPSPDAWRK